jgi:hypothetical protein
MCKGKPQNRIDYIVLQKPKEAAEILEKYGYDVPRSKEDLAYVTRQLVRKKGEKVITELIAIHPDKELILQVTGHSAESNFCGCQSAYTGEIKDYMTKLSSLSVDDLSQMYDDAKKKLRENPADKATATQVEGIWDELKKRKQKQQDDKGKQDKEDQASHDLWMHLGLAFLGGIVLAKLL